MIRVLFSISVLSLPAREMATRLIEKYSIGFSS